jgi:uncharacterized Fe-S cluster-containing radical SAM superfamily protein
MTTVYSINLDFRCNERCVFCAADLGGKVPAAVRKPSLTLERIREWLGDAAPAPADRVLLSGGEPTLHRDLIPITRYLSARCREVVLFTNAVRLSDARFARATADAGISRYEISVYGADAAAHDAITCRSGSFGRTMRALRELSALRDEFGIWISVRLLISRLTVAANPDIIRRVASDVGAIDSFSLNRLVMSSDALASNAPISWATARGPVNECARLARQLGYRLEFASLPLCVFDAGNAPPVIEERTHFEYRYLDPVLPASDLGVPRRSALPDVCLGCALSSTCGRVDRDYLRLFGEEGLAAIPADIAGTAAP